MIRKPRGWFARWEWSKNAPWDIKGASKLWRKLTKKKKNRRNHG